MGPQETAPPFAAMSTESGTLHITWAPFPGGSRAAVIVALREVSEELAGAFWAGELDNDLIRKPVDAASGSETVHVPAGRVVHVALVVRGTGGEVLATLPVRSAARPASDARTLESPVSHDSEASHETPLVFADGQAPAGFKALARRVAAQTSGGETASVSSDVTNGFGARQRWTLTRLQWRADEEGPLALVVRDTFIDEQSLTSWETQLPQDALQIDGACDSLIDAKTPHDAISFYVVLRGPAPWSPLALSPVAPPFDTVTHPHVLGDLSAGLSEGVRGLVARLETEQLVLSDLEPQLLMLRGAVAVLSEADPLRSLVDETEARWRAGQRT